MIGFGFRGILALAETSRQVGRHSPGKMVPEIRPPIYNRRLARLAEATGQVVRVEELTDY